MVRFLLRDAVVLTVSLRQGPPKAPGKASRRFDREILFDVQILQAFASLRVTRAGLEARGPA
jgi:hypothetical protein